jgi:hypothetical protein
MDELDLEYDKIVQYISDSTKLDIKIIMMVLEAQDDYFLKNELI